MQAPVPSELEYHHGRSDLHRRTERTVSLADPPNLLSLTTLTDQVTVNGRTFTHSFDAATKTFTDTTAAGRQTVTTIDAQGRVDPVDGSLGFLPASLTMTPVGDWSRSARGPGAISPTATFSYDTQRLPARHSRPPGPEFKSTA